MSISECLKSAADQGAISRREADELERYYNARFKSKKKAGLDDITASRQARDEVTAELRAEAAENQRRLHLTEAKRKELEDYLKNYRTISGKVDMLDAVLSKMIHNGYAGSSSMQGRENAIVSLSHAKLAEVMHHFRRGGGRGVRHAKADLPDFVRALSGEKTDNPEINALASAVKGVQEDLRLRFNAAGGNIPKRNDFDLSHKHDARKMLKLGKTADEAKENWKAIIRPLLNPEEMTNPRTGEIIGKAGLDDSLDYVWDSIISDGWAHRKPEARRFGSGAIHSKYQDSRFLEFKDSTAWLRYNEQFGTGDPISTIFNQINNMAADIAALETFGPNPDAMLEWLKQMVNVEYGKARAGDDQLSKLMMKRKKLKRAEVVNYQIDALWKSLRGRETVWTGPAKVVGDIRNIATAAFLGSTSVLAAATDPVISALGRALAGNPVFKNFGAIIPDLVREAKSSSSSLKAARQAVIWEDYRFTANQEMRFIDQVFGHDWSNTFVDRALTWNGLKPLTAARIQTGKKVFATTRRLWVGSFPKFGLRRQSLKQRRTWPKMVVTKRHMRPIQIIPMMFALPPRNVHLLRKMLMRTGLSRIASFLAVVIKALKLQPYCKGWLSLGSTMALKMVFLAVVQKLLLCICNAMQACKLMALLGLKHELRWMVGQNRQAHARRLLLVYSTSTSTQSEINASQRTLRNA